MSDRLKNLAKSRVAQTKIEVTPGMFSSAPVKVSMKAGLTMAFFTVLVLLAFGVYGSSKNVTFQLNEAGTWLSVPDFTVSSSGFSLLLGGVLGFVTLVSTFLTIRNHPTPMWLSLFFGLVGATSLLAWLAAGASVPLPFILSNAVVLAVPIILGALGGVMSERVGVVNIAIEGQLLTGAFVSAVVGTMTGNLYVGMVAAMVAAGKGNIVNIASTAGLRGGRNRPIYSASKGAVVMFTRSIAIDFGPKGVRANSVAPGLIDTPMASWLSDDKEALAKWEKTIAAQRIGTPDDIGKAVSYLASDASSFVFGETLVVDGGGMA